MRFRTKVLAANIILLSLSLGLLGYLLLHQSFTLAFKNQQNNALLQNNLIQSNVEYELLSIINEEQAFQKMQSALPDIGTRVHSGLMSQDADFFIYLNDQVLYQSCKELPPKHLLFDKLELGQKQMVVSKQGKQKFMYITSMNTIRGNNLFVVTKTDISSIYQLLQKQCAFFQFALALVLFLCSLVMAVICRMLTRPLEQLEHVSQSLGKGDYSVRSKEQGNDEITELSIQFNQMAASIEDHVAVLNLMIKRKEQFVADFTHEMKTPMTSIIGYADYIRSKETENEKIFLAANYIASEGKRLETMSRKLFDLIYLSQNDITRKKIYVCPLLTEIRESVQPLLSNKQLYLELKVTEDSILGDRDLLKTVFINLIDNAQKASFENGSITICGQVISGSEYEFQVTDHGIGMKPEIIKKVCDEFFMADKSRSRKEGGAGLGLSLVQSIITHHQGTLQIKSEEGIGTTAIIRLPRATADSQTSHPQGEQL